MCASRTIIIIHIARYTFAIHSLYIRSTSRPMHTQRFGEIYAGRKRSTAHRTHRVARTQGRTHRGYAHGDRYRSNGVCARRLSIFSLSLEHTDLCVRVCASFYSAAAEKHFRRENPAKFSDLRSRSVLKVL